MRDELAALTEMSNRYGGNADYVLAGGGNTSVKIGPILYVKGSGTSLATIQAEDFVSMDREKLGRMLEKQYPETDAEREAAALTDLMAARLPENGEKRPSVETLLHNLFPFQYVLHVHPALINGLTCSQGAETRARELLGDDFVWIPIYRPGYALASLCANKLAKYKAIKGKDAQVVLLQNHGIFIAADTVEDIDGIMAGIMQRLVENTPSKPRTQASAYDPIVVRDLSYSIADLSGENTAIEFLVNPDILDFLSSRETFQALENPFTPDHIVYCKAEFIYIETPEVLPRAWKDFVEQNGYSPRVICVRDVGAFFAGPNVRTARTARDLFEDAVKIAVYAENFGGFLHMTDELVDFIRNWEMEAYRSRVAGG